MTNLSKQTNWLFAMCQDENGNDYVIPSGNYQRVHGSIDRLVLEGIRPCGLPTCRTQTILESSIQKGILKVDEHGLMSYNCAKIGHSFSIRSYRCMVCRYCEDEKDVPKGSLLGTIGHQLCYLE